MRFLHKNVDADESFHRSVAILAQKRRKVKWSVNLNPPVIMHSCKYVLTQRCGVSLSLASLTCCVRCVLTKRNYTKYLLKFPTDPS